VSGVQNVQSLCMQYPFNSMSSAKGVMIRRPAGQSQPSIEWYFNPVVLCVSIEDLHHLHHNVGLRRNVCKGKGDGGARGVRGYMLQAGERKPCLWQSSGCQQQPFSDVATWSPSINVCEKQRRCLVLCCALQGVGCPSPGNLLDTPTTA
jgi:hypothetical protein